MKRPSHMTDAERRALPIVNYGAIETIVPLTEEDRARGMRGRTKVVRERVPVLANHYEPSDLIWWRDRDGSYWQFGQFLDGSWYKEPTAWL